MSKPTGNTGYLTDLDIRIWMRDNDPSENFLLDDYEFTPEEIRTASTLTVDYWNEMPPQLRGYQVHTFPWRFALLRGTAANLLFMAAHRFRRNALSYSAGGLAVADQDKYKQYDEAGSKLWGDYKEWVVLKKREINTEIGWGSI